MKKEGGRNQRWEAEPHLHAAFKLVLDLGLTTLDSCKCINSICKPGYVIPCQMWLIKQENSCKPSVCSAVGGVSTNIMSSASTLWKEDEIHALIVVWGKTGIQEEQVFEFPCVESANPDFNLVQCNPDLCM